MAGLATGRVVLERLDSAGIRVTQWRWRYAPELSRHGGQFPPHRALAGTFHDWEPNRAQPTVDGFYPGDHAQRSQGCLCDVVPVLRSAETGRFVPPPEGS